jgi:hypothetical protein
MGIIHIPASIVDSISSLDAGRLMKNNIITTGALLYLIAPLNVCSTLLFLPLSDIAFHVLLVFCTISSFLLAIGFNSARKSIETEEVLRILLSD